MKCPAEDTQSQEATTGQAHKRKLMKIKVANKYKSKPTHRLHKADI